MIYIGHAGCYYGLPNSEEAFINGVVKQKYQALECDVKQTLDGVFVMSHDDFFEEYELAKTTYEELKDVVKTKKRGDVIYSAKICTLDRYLDICKEHNVIAVIELKYSKGINNQDTSRMKALLEEIERKGMLDKIIFLTSQYECLKWTRENGYENIPCQYLVSSCENEEYFERCINYNFDISINIDKPNSYEWIKKYQLANKKVSTYTFSQYSKIEDLKKWIDYGVDFVTVDVFTEKDILDAYKK